MVATRMSRKRPDAPGELKLAPSNILRVLGHGLLAEVRAVRIPGRVIWFNFELASQMGIEVPAFDEMTPEFHRKVIDAFSCRVAKADEIISPEDEITLYADKYGGDGVAPALGSARAGFLPWGDLFIKGIGRTPLFKHNDPNDFAHSHGGLNMWQSIAEAVCGEVNTNLLSKESNRMLVIIDQGDFTIPPNRRKIPRAIAVRAGNQLRPAHVLARHLPGYPSRLDTFLAITQETGQLVTRMDARTRSEVPDIAATMTRIIDDHARTAAEQARWRVTHCALSTSNMQMDGGMLDLTTQRTNARSAPLRPARYVSPETGYYTDYIDRTYQMGQLYKALLRSVSKEQKELLNATLLDIRELMHQSYIAHLESVLLCAAGFKSLLARRISAGHKELAREFCEAMMELTGLTNPGSVEGGRLLIDDVAVVDVHNLLREAPKIFFDERPEKRVENIVAALRPVYKGNRFRRARTRSTVVRLAEKFASVYASLARTGLSYASEYYGGRQKMKKAVRSRAEFENRPVNLLYRKSCLEASYKAIRAYKASGDMAVLRDLIDYRVNASLRNVESILRQGRRLMVDDTTWEVEIRVIRGLRYSVIAATGRRPTRWLSVVVPLDPAGEKVRFRFTADGGVTWRECRGKEETVEGRRSMRFVIKKGFPPVGCLRGYVAEQGASQAPQSASQILELSYPYALPDALELKELSISNR